MKRSPPTVWPRYLLASLAVILAAALVGRLLPPAALARAWFVLGGVAGLVLLFFWFGTDHAVARLNLNVLVLNPLWLVFVARGRAARYALPVVSILAALAVAAALILLAWAVGDRRRRHAWLFGLGVLAGLVMMLLRAPAEMLGIGDLAMLVDLVLAVWLHIALGNVLRHALEIPLLAGVMVVLSYTVLAFNLIARVFPPIVPA